MGRSQRGEGLIFCVGLSHGKEAVLVLQKVETAFCFYVKKKKKYILKTQGNLTKAQVRGRERSPWKELTNEKAVAGLEWVL